MSIQVNQLEKWYGTQAAVSNLSFNCAPGVITGFLGPNGAGKSTTMKMITGYLKPDKGSISICGIDALQHPLEARRKTGYLPESNALYYDMFVREYLIFSAGMYGMKKAGRAVESVMDRVGLMPESGKKIGQLSKGYKQRVGLAAAMLHHPEVLVLDEPTSGLDPNQIVDIRNLIQELGREKTVLLSTHIMQEVEAICDQVIIIHRGKIVANDSLSRLQQQRPDNQLRVSFAETIEASVLAQLPGVEQVSGGANGSWVLTTRNNAEARRQVMQLVLDRGLQLQSLQEGVTLESLFRELTTAS